MSDQSNPYAAPKANVDRPEGADGELVDASRWQRLGASFLDSIVVWLLPFVLMTAWHFMNRNAAGEMPPLFGNAYLEQLFTSVLFIVLYTLINWRGLSSSGQSVGKRAVGIRIVMLDGQQASGQTGLLRMVSMSLLGLIPFAGVIIALIDALRIFAADRRCFHDIVFGTRVVKV